MTIPRTDPGRGGFTLSEILIALGIFSIAVTGLMTLFPVAQKTEREATQEWQSAMIASGIMETLALPSTQGKLRLAVGLSNGCPRWDFFKEETPADVAVLYDSSCEPVRPLGAQERDLPIPGHDGTAVATLRLSRKASLPGVTVAEVDVASPAAAPVSGRSVRRFVRLLENLRDDE